MSKVVSPVPDEQPQQQVDPGKQGTQVPWKRPGQSSQNPDQPAPKKRDRDYDDNKTS